MRTSLCCLAAAAFVLAAPQVSVRAAVPDDPCATVAKATAASALGVPIVRLSRRSVGPSESCAFRSANSLPYASVTAFRYDSLTEAAAGFRQQTSGAATLVGYEPTSIPGIGDEAEFLDGLLYARKGHAVYVFSVVDGSSQHHPLPKAEKFAKLALASVKP